MKTKSNLFSVVLISISILALMFYIFFVDGIENVVNIFLKCSSWWLFFGLLLMVTYWAFECYILNKCFNIFNKKLSIGVNIKNCILGQFFNNITPSATGGQPFQVIYINRYGGIKYGVAIGALIVKFICFQISLTAICSFVLLVRFKYFLAKIQGFVILVFIGFTVNVIVAVALMLVGFNKSFALFLINSFVKILGKLKVFKETEKKLTEVKKEVSIFNRSIRIAFENPKKLLEIFFLSTVQLLCFYYINVVIAFVFGMKPSIKDMLNIICGAACVQMSSSFIPLPGAIGGAELLYVVIYEGVFSSNYMSTTLLLWRIYTFYLPIVAGLISIKLLFKNKKVL